MKRRKSLAGASFLFSAILAGACAGPSARDTSSLRIHAEQAVMNAAAVAPEGVNGIFEIAVRGTGRSGGRLFLNSERDYRDPRALNIAIAPAIEQQLEARFGRPPATHLEGKTIAVRGTAKRVRIEFTQNGRRSGKYYYQTHVVLEEARHLTVSGEPPTA
ncbi:MAG: hypothetical protein WA979_04915 [Pacificimonas sp.]